jgi:hypothetical protein
MIEIGKMRRRMMDFSVPAEKRTRIGARALLLRHLLLLRGANQQVR